MSVSFVGRLNEEEMRKMYLETTLIFPSYIETVGLPLLEAQVFDSWILCSNLEYSRESIGSYSKAKFFNPFLTEDISKCICDYLTSECSLCGDE